MKILTILGARPQFIKAATVSRAIREHNASDCGEIKEIIVHTGQHYDAKMSNVFFEEMDIPKPNYKLDCGNLSHGSMTGRMLEGIEELIVQEKPDYVLVYGDTNSTLAGALAASKLHIPIAHVEAGLRSFNMSMPEEINRVLTDRVSSYLFCPTETAIKNLEQEGFPYPTADKKLQKIFNVGDVMYDATLFYAGKARESVSLEKWGLNEKGYALCTIHRAENTDDSSRLVSIFEALLEINEELPVILPLHPRTQNILKKIDQLALLENLTILEPLSFVEIQRLEMSARVILTDSGGMQKEAFFHGVPCITLRDETEWVETVECGWNTIVGSNKIDIIKEFKSVEIKQDRSLLFGDGSSSKKIIKKMYEN